MKSEFEPTLLTDIDERRLAFAKKLYPNTTTIAGDINEIKDEIIGNIKELVGDAEFLLSMTPPCQGMSQNGIKSIHKAVLEGKRPKVDSRNYLLVSGLKIISETKPSYVFFENVPQVRKTYILVDNREITIANYLTQRMEEMGYRYASATINFANYGVPQNRRRYVAIFTNKLVDPKILFPDRLKRRVSMGQVLRKMPHLDAQDKITSQDVSFHPLHKVPVMRAKLYSWVSATNEGHTAFENNTCTRCCHVNAPQNVTCVKCKVTLPKPHVIRDGKPVLIKGYSSSYRRQELNKPASTVTTRSAFASSSCNLHPIENRVLSAYECAILQGIKPKEHDWRDPSTGKFYPDFLVREMIGEAVPPTFTYKVGSKILQQNKPTELSKVMHVQFV